MDEPSLILLMSTLEAVVSNQRGPSGGANFQKVPIVFIGCTPSKPVNTNDPYYFSPFSISYKECVTKAPYINGRRVSRWMCCNCQNTQFFDKSECKKCGVDVSDHMSTFKVGLNGHVYIYWIMFGKRKKTEEKKKEEVPVGRLLTEEESMSIFRSIVGRRETGEIKTDLEKMGEEDPEKRAKRLREAKEKFEENGTRDRRIANDFRELEEKKKDPGLKLPPLKSLDLPIKNATIQNLPGFKQVLTPTKYALTPFKISFRIFSELEYYTIKDCRINSWMCCRCGGVNHDNKVSICYICFADVKTHMSTHYVAVNRKENIKFLRFGKEEEEEGKKSFFKRDKKEKKEKKEKEEKPSIVTKATSHLVKEILDDKDPVTGETVSEQVHGTFRNLNNLSDKGNQVADNVNECVTEIRMSVDHFNNEFDDKIKALTDILIPAVGGAAFGRKFVTSIIQSLAALVGCYRARKDLIVTGIILESLGVLYIEIWGPTIISASVSGKLKSFVQGLREHVIEKDKNMEEGVVAMAGEEAVPGYEKPKKRFVKENVIGDGFSALAAIFGKAVGIDVEGEEDIAAVKDLASAFSSVKTIGSFVLWVISLITKAIDLVYCVVYKHPRLTAATSAVVNKGIEWVKKVDEKVYKEVDVRQKIGFDYNYAIEIIDLYIESTEIEKELMKHQIRPKSFSLFYEMRGKLQQLYDIAKKMKNVGYPRPCPVRIMLHGEPGRGKSEMTRWLTAAVLAKLGIQFSPNQIYGYNRLSEFYDGYKGQFTFLIDDYGQVQEDEALTKEHMLWIQAGQTTPMHMQMADLSEKESTFFNSRLLIGTTNAKPKDGGKVAFQKGRILSMDAFLGRIDFLVEVNVRPDLMTKDIRGPQINNWDVSIWNLTYRNPISGMMIKKNVTFNEFVEDVYDKYVMFTKNSGNTSATQLLSCLTPEQILSQVQPNPPPMPDVKLPDFFTSGVAHSMAIPVAQSGNESIEDLEEKFELTPEEHKRLEKHVREKGDKRYQVPDLEHPVLDPEEEEESKVIEDNLTINKKLKTKEEIEDVDFGDPDSLAEMFDPNIELTCWINDLREGKLDAAKVKKLELDLLRANFAVVGNEVLVRYLMFYLKNISARKVSTPEMVEVIADLFSSDGTRVVSNGIVEQLTFNESLKDYPKFVRFVAMKFVHLKHSKDGTKAAFSYSIYAQLVMKKSSKEVFADLELIDKYRERFSNVFRKLETKQKIAEVEEMKEKKGKLEKEFSEKLKKLKESRPKLPEANNAKLWLVDHKPNATVVKNLAIGVAVVTTITTVVGVGAAIVHSVRSVDSEEEEIEAQSSYYLSKQKRKPKMKRVSTKRFHGKSAKIKPFAQSGPASDSVCDVVAGNLYKAVVLTGENKRKKNFVGKTVHLLFVDKRMAITTGHVFGDAEKGLFTDPDATIHFGGKEVDLHQCEFIFDNGQDLVQITFPNCINEHKDISHHFATVEDLPETDYMVDCTLITKNMKGDTTFHHAEKVALLKDQEYVDNDGGEYSSAHSVFFPSQTEYGMCGAPYIAKTDKKVYKIIAHHVAGLKDGGFGTLTLHEYIMSLPHFQKKRAGVKIEIKEVGGAQSGEETFLPVEDNLAYGYTFGPDVKRTIVDVDTRSKSFDLIKEKVPKCDYIAVIDKKFVPQTPKGTDIRISNIGYDVAQKHPPSTVPCTTGGFIPDSKGGVTTPYWSAFGKLSKDRFTPIPRVQKLIDQNKEVILDELKAQFSTPRVLSDSEAINGVYGFEFVTSKNMDGSLGFPYTMMYQKEITKSGGGARCFYERDTDGKWKFSDIGKKHIGEAETAILGGEKRLFPFRLFGKDEKKSPKWKVREDCDGTEIFEPFTLDDTVDIDDLEFYRTKMRIIWSAPEDFKHLCRKYMGAFQEQYVKQCQRNGAAKLAMNPHSVDGHLLFNELHEVAVKLKIVGGDYAGFDTWMTMSILEAIFWVINQWYSRYAPHDPIGEMVRDILFNSVRYPVALMFEFLVMIRDQIPSGWPLTALFNSLANDLAIRVIVQLILEDFGCHEYEARLFRKYFRDPVLGDDNLIATGEKYGKYVTLPNISDYARDYLNMTYTDFRKELVDFKDLWPDHHEIMEVEFLKRQFVLDEYHITHMALRKSVIYDILIYVTKNIPSSKATEDNAKSACMEAFHWGREFFENFKSYVNGLLGAYGLETVTYSYDSLYSKFIHGGFEEEFTTLSTPRAQAGMTWFNPFRKPIFNKEELRAIKFQPGRAYVRGRSLLKRKEEILGRAQSGEDEFQEGEVINQINETDALTSFADMTGATDIGNDPMGSAHRGFNTLGPQHVEAVLSRMVTQDFIWDTSFTFGDTLFTRSFPKDLIDANDIFWRVLRQFQFFRAGIEISFRMNTTQFHAGKLIVAWCPHRKNVETDLPGRAQAPYWMSGFQHGILSANTPSVVTIKIPYVSPRQYWNTTHWWANEIDGNFGKMIVSVLNDLKVSGTSVTPPVTVSVMMKFVDIEVTGPTTLLTKATVPTERAVAQSGVGNVPNLTKGPDNRKKEQALQTRQRVISPILRAVGDISWTLGTFTAQPWMTSVLTPAARALEKMAESMGYNRPTSVEAVAVYAPTLCETLVHGSGRDGATKLAMSPTNQVSTSPLIFGDNRDYALFSNYKCLPGLVAVVDFDTTAEVGGSLLTIPVTPRFCHSYLLFANTVEYHTHLSHLASHFLYWRGSNQYSVQITTNGFIAGRLRILWVPNVAHVPSDVTIDGAANYPSVVVDFRGDTNFLFSVPYLQTTEYLYSANNYYNEKTDLNAEGCTNGALIFSLTNDLAYTGESTDVKVWINVWQSGGADMQFSRPVSNKQEDLSLAKAQSGQEDVEWMFPRRLHEVDFPPLHPSFSTNVRGGLVTGEEIQDWRTYWHRYTAIVRDNISIRHEFDYYDPNLPKESAFFHFLQAFNFWRGSLRFKMLPDYANAGGAAYDGAMIVAHLVPLFYDYSHQPNVFFNQFGIDGFTLQDPKLRTCLEVELPYYDNMLMRQMRHLFDTDVFSQEKRGGQTVNFFQSRPEGDTHAPYCLYIAAGDDISFGCPIPPSVTIFAHPTVATDRSIPKKEDKQQIILPPEYRSDVQTRGEDKYKSDDLVQPRRSRNRFT